MVGGRAIRRSSPPPIPANVVFSRRPIHLLSMFCASAELLAARSPGNWNARSSCLPWLEPPAAPRERAGAPRATDREGGASVTSKEVGEGGDGGITGEEGVDVVDGRRSQEGEWIR